MAWSLVLVPLRAPPWSSAPAGNATCCCPWPSPGPPPRWRWGSGPQPPAWRRLRWGEHLVLGLAVEGLAWVMVVLVPAIALPVIAYAGASLGRDAGLTRLLSLLLAFVGAMVVLVAASNLLTLLVGWELVGMASWALVAHDWHDPQTPPLALHALLATRTGDLGLVAAAGVALAVTGTTDYRALGDLSGWPVHAVAAGLLVAAAAKSAQLLLALAVLGHGRPHPGQRPAPLGHHGGRRRLRPGPHRAPPRRRVVARPGGRRPGAGHRAGRRAGGQRPDRPQAGAGGVDLGPVRPRPGGRGRRLHRRRRDPPGHPRHAQVTAVPRRRRGPPRRRHPRPALARPGPGPALRRRHLRRGGPGPGRRPPLGAARSKEDILAAAVHDSAWLGAGVLVASFLSAVYAGRLALLAFGPGIAEHRGRSPGRSLDNDPIEPPPAVERWALGALAAATLALSALWLPGAAELVEGATGGPWSPARRGSWRPRSPPWLSPAG